MNLRPLILAGGSGTRFWPLSRRGRPKQFLALASERPLLWDTVQRLSPLATPRDLLVSCGAAHAAAIRRLLPKVPRGNLIVEPVGRNTGPCVAVAAAIVARRSADAVLAVLPADAYVADAPAFRADLAAAAAAAADGYLVTLGIRPTRPETGYGYIELGEATGAGPARRAARFEEKPDLARAREYLAGGRHLWNAGIFVARADAMVAAFDRHLPEVARGAREIAAAHGTRRFDAAMRRVFPKLPAISIDYGVMQNATNVLVVAASFGWSDLGSYAALPEVRPADARGNVMAGQAIAVDSESCVVLAGLRPVAVLGGKRLVVVDAGDAVLVCPVDRSQDVRQVVEELARRKAHRYL